MSKALYERNQNVFAAKTRRRRALAELPFEEKLKILVELQSTAYKIKQDQRYKPWNINFNRASQSRR
jgi:hypothetical protein